MNGIEAMTRHSIHRHALLVATILAGAHLVAAATLKGQVTRIHVDSYRPDPELLSGYVTNDIFMDFQGQLSGSKLMLMLSEGSIYDEPLNGYGPRDPVLLEQSPVLAYDLFFTLGSPTSGGPYGFPLLVGGACNLSGAPCPRNITSEMINIGWSPAAGVIIRDQQDFLTARVTLTDDARGTWSYLASANGVIWESPTQPVINGRMVVIPEPAAAALGVACVACVGICRPLRTRKHMARRLPRTMIV